MTLAGLLVRDVIIMRATTTTDAYGDTIQSWTTPTETDTKGWIAQLSSLEERDQSTGEVTTWHLTVPADTDLTAQDRVTVDGDVYELTGPPHRAWTPRGEHHLEAELRLVEG